MAERRKNIAASVKARLLNLAREQSRGFDVSLVRFALERLLLGDYGDVIDADDGFVFAVDALIASAICEETEYGSISPSPRQSTTSGSSDCRSVATLPLTRLDSAYKYANGGLCKRPNARLVGIFLFIFR